MKYCAMRTKPGSAEKARVEDAGPEREQWVNNGDILGDSGEIKGVTAVAGSELLGWWQAVRHPGQWPGLFEAIQTAGTSC